MVLRRMGQLHAATMRPHVRRASSPEDAAELRPRDSPAEVTAGIQQGVDVVGAGQLSSSVIHRSQHVVRFALRLSMDHDGAEAS